MPDISKFTTLLQKLTGVGYQRFGSEFASIADWLEFYRDRGRRGYQEFDEQWPTNDRTEACREFIMLSRPSYKHPVFSFRAGPTSVDRLHKPGNVIT